MWSGCLVVCIAYTFNKITKPQNNKTTILNIDVLLKDKPTKSVHFFHISAKDNHPLTTNWYSIDYKSIVFRLQKHSYWEVITMLLQPNIYVIASWKLSHVTLTDFTLHFSRCFTKLLHSDFILLLNSFTLQEKCYWNALHGVSVCKVNIKIFITKF